MKLVDSEQSREDLLNKILNFALNRDHLSTIFSLISDHEKSLQSNIIMKNDSEHRNSLQQLKEYLITKNLNFLEIMNKLLIKQFDAMNRSGFNKSEWQRYNIFKILHPLINIRSLMKVIINRLFSIFSQIRAVFNPRAPLTIAEKKSSIYSKLFELAAKKYKVFNKFYRDFLKYNYSETQILHQFFNLIKDEQVIRSKLDQHHLFLQAEKKLLGKKQRIITPGVEETIAAKVAHNLNQLNELASLVNNDYVVSYFEDNKQKIEHTKIIIKNLVIKIQIQAQHLESLDSQQAKLKLYKTLQTYKRKLCTFILKTHALANGEVLALEKTIDLNYIKQQFAKLPNRDLSDDLIAKDLLVYPLPNHNKLHSALKLFKPSSNEIIEQVNVEKVILDPGQAQINSMLVDLKAAIKIYRDLRVKLNGKRKEQEKLKPIVLGLTSMVTNHNQVKGNLIILRDGALAREIHELEENFNSLEKGIFDILAGTYKQEFYLINQNLSSNSHLEITNYINFKTKAFFSKLSSYHKPEVFDEVFIENNLLNLNIDDDIKDNKNALDALIKLQDFIKELTVDMQNLFNHEKLLDSQNLLVNDILLIKEHFKISNKIEEFSEDLNTITPRSRHTVG